MGIQIGGIDPVSEIVDLNVRIFTLEKLLNIALQKNQIQISQVEIDNARIDAMKQVIAKFPQLKLRLE